MTSGLVGLTLAASLGLAYASPGSATPAPPVGGEKSQKVGKDDLRNPLESKRRELRESGVTSVLNGDAKAVTKDGTSVVKVGKGYSPAAAAALANKRTSKAERKALR
ncbi:MAG: protease, partial [Aeromicrobium sp.]